MTNQAATLGHAILYCRDVARMEAFYVDEMGFVVTDRGNVDGTEFVFTAIDPTAHHHNLALVSGRDADGVETALNHLAFKLPTLPDLRKRVDAAQISDSASKIGFTNHCISWSMYLRDPEDNRIEFYVESPFFVPQPLADPLDISLSDAEIVRTTEETYRDRPGFQPMAEWKASWQTAVAAQ